MAPSYPYSLLSIYPKASCNARLSHFRRGNCRHCRDGEDAGDVSWKAERKNDPDEVAADEVGHLDQGVAVVLGFPAHIMKRKKRLINLCLQILTKCNKLIL